LVIYCVVVVGTVDNLLRPKLVGSDTQLHELYIFFSTLGGLLLFGFMGFIIGPIIAALFVTIWEVYGEEFSDWLPTTAFRPRSRDIVLPHQRSMATKVKGGQAAQQPKVGDKATNKNIVRKTVQAAKKKPDATPPDDVSGA